jgi:hypothetical protein
MKPEQVLELAHKRGFKNTHERQESIEAAILEVLLEIRDSKKE